MKILVIGHAQHGKDSVGLILKQEFGLYFESSSLFLCDRVVRPYLALHLGIVYQSTEEAYADRVNYRKEWSDAIAEYNKPNKAALGREIFSQFDMYVGCRKKDEVDAMRAQKVFDVCFWVDACQRMPLEPVTSMTLSKEDADFFIDNNGPEADLAPNVRKVYNLARLKHWKGSAL